MYLDALPTAAEEFEKVYGVKKYISIVHLCWGYQGHFLCEI